MKWLPLLLPGIALLLFVGCQDNVPEVSLEDSLYDEFSGENAYTHVQALVDFGPRPSGSPELEASVEYLEAELAKLGWQTQRQTFQDDTPRGELTFINLRARFGGEEDAPLWKKQARLLVGSHIDTKWFTQFRFVGANDSGSSTGALLELARVTKQRPDFARSLELVFFDGEEAVENYTDSDGLYGSRHYVKQLIRPLDPKQWPKALVLLDMVGERKLNIRVPSDSPRHLTSLLLDTAEELGHRKHFGVWPTPILDDHIPFQNAGMDAIDLIDFDFKEWHTAGDTMDIVTAASLEISGQVTVRYLERLLAE